MFYSFCCIATLFQVLVEFCESRKVVSLEEQNSMVKLIKDAFRIEGKILLQELFILFILFIYLVTHKTLHNMNERC